MTGRGVKRKVLVGWSSTGLSERSKCSLPASDRPSYTGDSTWAMKSPVPHPPWAESLLASAQDAGEDESLEAQPGR